MHPNVYCSRARGVPGHGDHSSFIVFIMCIVLQPRTPLELEIVQLLHGSKNVFKKEKMLTPAEERALRAMNLEEVQSACVYVWSTPGRTERTILYTGSRLQRVRLQQAPGHSEQISLHENHCLQC